LGPLPNHEDNVEFHILLTPDDLKKADSTHSARNGVDQPSLHPGPTNPAASSRPPGKGTARKKFSARFATTVYRGGRSTLAPITPFN